MEQRITQEQLNELSEKQQEKLLAWWQVSSFGAMIDDLGGCGNPECCTSRMTTFDDIQPLSIGEMIELLDEHDNDELAFRLYLLTHPGTKIKGKKWSFDTKALLTTLWEGIKTVLGN